MRDYGSSAKPRDDDSSDSDPSDSESSVDSPPESQTSDPKRQKCKRTVKRKYSGSPASSRYSGSSINEGAGPSSGGPPKEKDEVDVFLTRERNAAALRKRLSDDEDDKSVERKLLEYFINNPDIDESEVQTFEVLAPGTETPLLQVFGPEIEQRSKDPEDEYKNFDGLDTEVECQFYDAVPLESGNEFLAALLEDTGYDSPNEDFSPFHYSEEEIELEAKRGALLYCGECDSYFEFLIDLRRHGSFHPYPSRMIDEDLLLDRRCIVCYRKYHNRESYIRHRTKHWVKRCYICEKCDEVTIMLMLTHNFHIFPPCKHCSKCNHKLLLDFLD